MTIHKLFKILKIAVGSTIAIILANILGLNYSASAGIITLLTIHDTKRDTIKLGWQRILTFILALVLSFSIFELFGYHTLSFGGFVLIFTTICYLLGFQDGISVNAVMITHILGEQNMSFSVLLNESSLMVIGVSIGILLNLFMPDMTSMIKKDQLKIEEDMKSILNRMALVLTQGSKDTYSTNCFAPLEEHIQSALKRSYENMNNSFQNESKYYIQYMEMRSNQSSILQKTYDKILLLSQTTPQAALISQVVSYIADSFHEYNNGIELLEKVTELKDYFKKQPLPITREEFENRAVLLQILYDLDEFLTLKKRFVEGLSQSQIQRYWTS